MTVALALPGGHPGGGPLLVKIRDSGDGVISVFWGLGVALLNVP
jgi:hypothetical protein